MRGNQGCSGRRGPDLGIREREECVGERESDNIKKQPAGKKRYLREEHRREAKQKKRQKTRQKGSTN